MSKEDRALVMVLGGFIGLLFGFGVCIGGVLSRDLGVYFVGIGVVAVSVGLILWQARADEEAPNENA